MPNPIVQECNKAIKQRDELREVLAVILDACDYTQHNCRPSEMVGAVLPAILIIRARGAIDNAKP